jgi:hypothetical protein
MSCTLSAGWNDRICTVGKGGIKSVLFFTKDQLTGASNPTIVANEITTMTVTGDTYHYKLKRDLSNATYPVRANDNGALYYEQTLSMILNNDTKELRAEIHLLAQNELVALVEKRNGDIIALGLDQGLQIREASEAGTGTAVADRNGHTIVMTSMEDNEVPDVAASVWNTLLGQAV